MYTLLRISYYEKLIVFAKKHNILIIHDNAYSDIIFTRKQGRSFLSFEGAKEVGVEFYSLSKSYNLTGARISFVVGNKAIIEKFKILRSQIDYGIFLPIQKAAIAALTGPDDFIEQQRQQYAKRNQALCGGLRRIGWNVPDSQGTMFVWAKIPEGYASSFEFCMQLVEKTGLLVTPGSAFGSAGEGYVRMALVVDLPVIEEILKCWNSRKYLIARREYKMEYQKVIEQARGCIGPYCKACAVCDGRACKNTMPGPGAKGIGDVAIRNFQKWQEIRINMDTICEKPSRRHSCFSVRTGICLCCFLQDRRCVKLHYGEKSVRDQQYNEVLLNWMREEGGIVASLGDGTDARVMQEATAAVRKLGGFGIPTVKPWDMDTIRDKMGAGENNPVRLQVVWI